MGFKDLTGKKFGRLSVIEQSERLGLNIAWRCLCECGQYINVITSSLNAGRTKSCGCMGKERAKNLNRSHGHWASRTYNSWHSMKQRCLNENNDAYENYGGRGISVCDRWVNSFENFLEDMGECPEGLTLERIDVNGNYCKENCIWHTRSRQGFNQRTDCLNTSGQVGVYFNKNANKWQSYITVESKNIYLGIYGNISDAIEARLQAEIKYYGFNPNR